MTIRSWLRSPHGGLLWFGLLLAGVVLLLTCVPGIFIVDEDHHLVALRSMAAGRLDVPDFDGLTYSSELAYFDPASRHRPPGKVTTAVPPLYPIVALPFYGLGVWGLIFLNVACFLACAAMVFSYARRYARRSATPWLALATFVLGGYSIEYAQGIWPHMLAVALCTGGLLLASRVRDGGPMLLAFLAGMLAGLAAGIRYQNIILAGCLGLGVFIWAPRRIRAGSIYLAGAAVPLLASSILNFLRYGSWNPISKGAHYLTLGAGHTLSNPIQEAFSVFWAKVVDFSTHPPLGETLQGVERMIHPDPQSGAFLLLGLALKKAWLQSAPWILLALVALLVAWKLPLGANFGTRKGDPQLREQRSMFLIFGCVLGAFSLAGFIHYDGLCFNQRYFLELVPLAAVALAWFVEDRRIRLPVLLAGCGLGLLVAVVPLLAWKPTDGFRHVCLQKIPLVLAGFLFLGWWFGRKHSNAWLGLLLGACLGWSATIHIGEDVATTNSVRAWRLRQQDAVAAILPPGKSAVFAYWGSKDGLGPLQLQRDLIIADPWIDEGRSASRLTRQFLGQGRRVFVLAAGMPKRIFDQIAEGQAYRLITEKPYPILEVTAVQRPSDSR